MLGKSMSGRRLPLVRVPAVQSFDQSRLCAALFVCGALACSCGSKASGDQTPTAGQTSVPGGAGAAAGGSSTGGTPATGAVGGTPADGAAGGTAGSSGAAPIASSNVTVTSRFPQNGSSACADAALRLSFSAPVTVGASGKIQVFKSDDPTTPVDSIDVTATTVQDTIAGRAFNKVRPIFIEGTGAVIYLKTKALAAPGSYFVSVDAGVFVDQSQALLPAIAGPDDWKFDTVMASPADPTALTVSREGDGDFCSVQGAVDFVPAANMAPTTITLKKGTYHEIVYIPAKHNLTFHGEDRKQSIIAYPNNDVLQAKRGTGFRAMVEAEGSNGLVFENLTLHDTTPQGGSQAEALRIEPGDQAILRDADFVSLQDTLLLSGRVYVTGSYVEGNVDFIWGKGTAYFENSEIKTVGRAGYLVQARNVGPYGYVFVDSTLSTDGAAANGTMLARIEGDRFPSSNVAYVNCKLGPHIAPKGWLITNSTGAPVASLDLSKLKFWEYQSTDLDGAPVDVSMRDPASRQITESEATALRDKTTVLAGWNPTPTPAP